MIVSVQGKEPVNDWCGDTHSLPCQPYHVLTYRVERLGYVPRRPVYLGLVFPGGLEGVLEDQISGGRSPVAL